MKIKAVPLKFSSVIENEYEQQLDIITKMFADEVEFLPSVAVGDAIPPEAQVVVFPVLVCLSHSPFFLFSSRSLPVSGPA